MPGCLVRRAVIAAVLVAAVAVAGFSSSGRVEAEGFDCPKVDAFGGGDIQIGCDIAKGIWQLVDYRRTAHRCWVTGVREDSALDGVFEDADGDRPEELTVSVLGEYGWGGPNEFILDRRDFWASIGKEGGGVLELVHENRADGYFESFAAAVDLVFYADRTDLYKARQFHADVSGQNVRGAVTPYVLLDAFLRENRDLEHVGGNNHYKDPGLYTYKYQDGPDQGLFRFPFVEPEAYYLRRLVADRNRDAVQGLDVGWEDPAAGPAGSDIDHAALASDTVAEQVEADRSFTAMARHGARLLNGTAQQDLIASEGELTLTCNPGVNPCAVQFLSNATTVTGQVVSSVVDINHHESTDSLPIPGVTLDVMDGEGNVTYTDRDGRTFLSRLDSRSTAEQTGYRKVLVIDSDNNNLRVDVVLDGGYRSDYEMEEFRAANTDLSPVRVFGVVPNTLPNMGDVPPFPEDYDGGVSTGSYERSGVHLGYRQPRVDDPWIEPGFERFFANLEAGKRRIGHQVLNVQGLDGGDHYVPDFYRIRWPVDFEDMNWVLYELPGDMADYDDRVAAFWHTGDARDFVVRSAYSQSHMAYETFFNELDCGFAEFDDPDGDAVYTDGVATVNTAICVPSPALAPLSSGDIHDFKGPGLYPFWSQTGLAVDGVPGIRSRMGLDMMTYYLAEKKVFDRDRMVEGVVAPDVLTRVQNWAIAVRAGVASPVGQDLLGERTLIDFPIMILEQDGPLGSGGELSDVKMGVPGDSATRSDFIDALPHRPIDPNHAHMMVVTFYQSAPVQESALEPTKQLTEVAYRFGNVAGTRYARIKAEFEACGDTPECRAIKVQAQVQLEEDAAGKGDWRDYPDFPADSEVVKIPKRSVRRVICRFYIGSAGHTAVDWGFSSDVVEFFNDTKDTIADLYSAVVNWYAAMTTTLGEGPIRMGEESVSAVCDGTSAIETATSSEVAPLDRSTVDANGVVVPSDAGNARQDHVALCTRLTIPDDVRCASASDALLEDGRCVNLPQMALKFSENSNEATFLDFDVLENLAPSVTKVKVGYGEPPMGAAFESNEEVETYTPGFTKFEAKASSLMAKGLTRVRVDFDFAWPNGVDQLYDSVKGYMVLVKPDAKVFGENGSYWRTFLLPSVVSEELIDLSDSNRAAARRNSYRVKSFWFGDLNALSGEPFGVAPFEYDLFASTTRLRVVGPPKVNADMHEFHSLLRQLPVAPGYQHQFRIIPYLDTREPNEWVIGRKVSNIFTVDGNTAACLALDPVDDLAAYEWYRCASVIPDPSGAGNQEDFRLGLLGLASSDLCGDIFSATPPQFTWDNIAVKRVWTFSWMIAGTLFFVLLVWQGFRMTYDMWLNPRPAVGFRELIPRYVLAILLAAMSLFLCKWILILSSDLTCFVAQTTGMTLWGVVGKSFLIIAEGFFGIYDTLLGSPGVPQSPVDAIRNMIVVNAVGFVVLIILIFILILFIMLCLKMLMRLVLLAVCVALSPIAFAFLASDATEHWTKKWVSIFLGAAFQQAVVLIVIYLGAFLIGNYLDDVNGTFTGFLISAILSMLVLSLANHVPKLVNPAGEGMFDSFGSMAKMAGTAAVVAVTAGAGAAVGAVRGPGGGAAGSASLGGGGGGGGIAGGGGGGIAGGGGGGAAAAGGGGGAGAGAATGAVGGPAGMAAGAAGGAVFSGLATAGRAAAGVGRHVGQGAIQGARSGIRTGQNINSNMQDVSSGGFLSRYQRSGDDSARAMDQMRQTIQKQNANRRSGP